MQRIAVDHKPSTVDHSLNLTFVNQKIFSVFCLNGKRIFVTIVVLQNIMKPLNTKASQFICDAIVGNPAYVLIIVIILVLKPAGAMMV